MKRLADRHREDASDPAVELSIAAADGLVKLDERVEAGFSTLLDAIEPLRKGRGLGSIAYSGSDYLAAIPDSERKSVQLAEQVLRSRGNKMGGEFDRPDFTAASALWFRDATRFQQRNYSPTPRQVEDFHRLDDALNDVEVKAAFAESSDGVGGYLVPTTVTGEVLRLIYDSSVFASVGRHVPMTSKQMNLPNEAAAFSAGWTAEATNLTGGENTFGVNALKAAKLYARATLSQEVVDDAIVGLLPYLQTVMSEQCGYLLDAAVSDGTDGNTPTSFSGLVTASGLNSVATTTTDGAAVAYSHLVKAMFKAGQRSTRTQAAWFMHPNIFAAVVGLVDSNGQPIFQMVGMPNLPEERILGRPVYTSAAMSVSITRGSTGSTGNIYFGPTNKLIFGDRMGLRWEVTNLVNWAKDQIDARLIGRFGFTIATPAAFTKIVGGTQIT